MNVCQGRNRKLHTWPVAEHRGHAVERSGGCLLLSCVVRPEGARGDWGERDELHTVTIAKLHMSTLRLDG